MTGPDTPPQAPEDANSALPRAWYPIVLDLRGAEVLVIGAGRVGSRKARDLAAAGAIVRVVAPQVSADLEQAAQDASSVHVHRREFLPGDVDGARLVVAATDDRAVNEHAARIAWERRIWAIRADDRQQTRAASTAIARDEHATIAVHSSLGPRHARRLRCAVSLLAEASHEDALVTLVGGGPGPAGLLTLWGLDALVRADAILYDRLGPHDIVAELVTEDPTLIAEDVGKTPGSTAHSQEEINRRIVELARSGKRVVRLKGGDPFVFGRGLEEAHAAARAGFAVRVVPGVTSAVSVPAHVGIPLTNRGTSSSFVVVTPDSLAEIALDPDHLGTVVVLMGVAAIDRVAEGLLARGISPSTPLAIVERGYRPGERTTRTTVGAVTRHPARPFAAPSVIVIGDVAALGITPDPSLPHSSQHSNDQPHHHSARSAV